MMGGQHWVEPLKEKNKWSGRKESSSGGGHWMSETNKLYERTCYCALETQKIDKNCGSFGRMSKKMIYSGISHMYFTETLLHTW